MWWGWRIGGGRKPCTDDPWAVEYKKRVRHETNDLCSMCHQLVACACSALANNQLCPCRRRQKVASPWVENRAIGCMDEAG
jgi:hypothetical protein